MKFMKPFALAMGIFGIAAGEANATPTDVTSKLGITSSTDWKNSNDTQANGMVKVSDGNGGFTYMPLRTCSISGTNPDIVFDFKIASNSYDAGYYVAKMYAYAYNDGTNSSMSAPTDGQSGVANLRIVTVSTGSGDSKEGGGQTADIPVYNAKCIREPRLYSVYFRKPSNSSSDKEEIGMGLHSDNGGKTHTNFYGIQLYSLVKYDSAKEAQDSIVADAVRKVKMAIATHKGYKTNSFFPGSEDSSKATKAYEDAIAVVKEDVDSVKYANANFFDADAEIAKLNTALTTYVEAGARPTRGNKFDMSFLIQNSGFDRGVTDGWTGTDDMNTKQAFGSNKIETGVAEFAAKTFNLYQKVSSLPKGKYTLTMDGFCRPGDYSSVVSAYSEESTTNVSLFAGDAKTAIKNIASSTGQLPFVTTDCTVDKVEKDDETTKYGPSNLSAAAVAFMNGSYTNSVDFECKNDTVTIGLKGGSTTDNYWTCFDNFRLYLTAPIADYILSETDTAMPKVPSDNYSYVDVTVNRKFVAGWNSVCLPVATTAATYTKTFGAKKVKKFDGIDVTKNTLTLNFADVAEGDSVAAGTPVMVKMENEAAAKDYNLCTASTDDGGVTECNYVTKISGTEQVTFAGTFVKSSTAFRGKEFALIHGQKIYHYKSNRSKEPTSYGTRAVFVMQSNNATGESSIQSIGGLDLDTVVTGIDGVAAADGAASADADGTVYDLSGRLVVNPAAGVYVKNGKKYVVK